MKFIFSSLVFIFTSTLWAQNAQILNQQIRNSGANWEAGVTEVSQLSDQEKLALLDKNLDKHPGILFSKPEALQTFASTAVDWRSKDGKNWTSSVRNQGSCGSCVAFASTTVMEAQYRISKGVSNAAITLSPGFLFGCGGAACKTGWYLESAAKFLQTKGVVDEACMPYKSSNGSNPVCSKACADAPARVRKISSYSRPTRAVLNIEKVKAALARGPLVTNLSVYNDFYSYKSGVYKHVTGKYVGGHAVGLVGYNDQGRYFIIQNSWGTTWGERGFGKISYDDISGLAVDTFKYEVSPNTKSNPFMSQMSDAQWEEESDVTVYQNTEAQALYLNRNVQVQGVTASTVLQLTLEAQELAAFDKLTLVQRRAGFRAKKIPVTAQGSALTVTINTALLAKGEWEFYFEGTQTIQGQDQTVHSDKVAYSAN